MLAILCFSVTARQPGGLSFASWHLFVMCMSRDDIKLVRLSSVVRAILLAHYVPEGVLTLWQPWVCVWRRNAWAASGLSGIRPVVVVVVVVVDVCVVLGLRHVAYRLGSGKPSAKDKPYS